jgi:hypothetical protein
MSHYLKHLFAVALRSFCRGFGQGAGFGLTIALALYLIKHWLK